MYIVTLVTAGSVKEGKLIARELIRLKLAACVNITENINSFFLWKGKVDNAREVLLVIKSRKDKFTGIVKLVKSLHSYDVPEIIALPVISGDKKYLEWIDDSLRRRI